MSAADTMAAWRTALRGIAPDLIEALGSTLGQLAAFLGSFPLPTAGAGGASGLCRARPPRSLRTAPGERMGLAAFGAARVPAPGDRRRAAFFRPRPTGAGRQPALRGPRRRRACAAGQCPAGAAGALVLAERARAARVDFLVVVLAGGAGRAGGRLRRLLAFPASWPSAPIARCQGATRPPGTPRWVRRPPARNAGPSAARASCSHRRRTPPSSGWRSAKWMPCAAEAHGRLAAARAAAPIARARAACRDRPDAAPAQPLHGDAGAPAKDPAGGPDSAALERSPARFSRRAASGWRSGCRSAGFSHLPPRIEKGCGATRLRGGARRGAGGGRRRRQPAGGGGGAAARWSSTVSPAARSATPSRGSAAPAGRWCPGRPSRDAARACCDPDPRQRPLVLRRRRDPGAGDRIAAGSFARSPRADKS